MHTQPLQTIAFVLLLLRAPFTLAQEHAVLTQTVSDSMQAVLQLAPSQSFSIEGLVTDKGESPQSVFYVTVHSTDLIDPPRLLGRYELLNGSLAFVPRFPLSNAIKYELRLGAKLSKQSQHKGKLLFRIPSRKLVPTAKIDGVFPSASELPENLLKFYIHFSEPMCRGEAYHHIRLYEGDRLVQEPFLELGEELWDSQQKRFTLFIHPGRIKQGLAPREAIGPVIRAGREYTLKISSQWEAAKGQPLTADFEKRFTITEADHERLNPELWKIETPTKSSLQPVKLVLDEPLDHAMLQRVLSVKRPDGAAVEGDVTIEDGESKWLFKPHAEWKVGAYNIHVATNLEDLCGNSIARPFEVKMQQRVASNPATQIAIEFIVE